MENEAILEQTGVSQTAIETEQPAATADREQKEAATECCNGVCVITWKPSRTAA